VPRGEIVPRFLEFAEKIRQEAIATGAAIAEDWEAD